MAHSNLSVPHPLESLAGTGWHTEFVDLVAPLAATRCVLEGFRDSAPTSEAAAYVQAFIDARVEIAVVTGVSF